MTIAWRLPLLILGISLLCSGPTYGQSLSQSTLHGDYGFRFAGNVSFQGTVPASPLFGSGVFTANGAGAITAGSATYSYNGNVCQTLMPPSGGYIVAPDGEATIELVFRMVAVNCVIETLTFDVALDALDALGVARHAELVGTGGVQPSAPGQALLSVALTGEANFQRVTPLVLAPCAITQQC